MANYAQADRLISAFLRRLKAPHTPRAWLRATESTPWDPSCLELRYDSPDGPRYVIIAELDGGRVRVLLPAAYPAEVSPRRAREVSQRLFAMATILGIPFASATFEDLNGD